MRTLVLLWLALATTYAAGQATPAKPTAKPDSAPTKKTVSTPAKTTDAGPAAVTIEGLCATKTTAPCKTVVTRAEFDRIIKVLQPNLPAARRKQLAQNYVEALVFATDAEKAGLAKDPEFQRELQEQMKLVRLRVLASAYGKYLQEKSAKIPDAEIEKYYNDNKEAYQEATLKRIYVPKPVPATAEKKPALDEAATKQLADKIRQRAASGEDFNTLQQEAFAAAYPDQPKSSAPSPDMGPRRRGSLPPQHEAKIFELKAGEVTPLLEEPSGYFIYKVEAIKVLPLNDVKSQIQRQMQEQRFRDSVEKTMSAVKPVYDEQYFGGSQATAPGAENDRRVPQGVKAPEAAPAEPKPAAPAPAPAEAKPAPAASPTPVPSPSATPAAK